MSRGQKEFRKVNRVDEGTPEHRRHVLEVLERRKEHSRKSGSPRIQGLNELKAETPKTRRNVPKGESRSGNPMVTVPEVPGTPGTQFPSSGKPHSSSSR